VTGWLTAPVGDLFGGEATAEESYGLLTVDVPAASWTAALKTARTALDCAYFDWLSAVDEPGIGFRVLAHVVALGPPVRRLLLRTTVPHEAPALASAVGVYAGANWHERETHEMFGIGFEGHPHLLPLLLPEGFEGHPLRKDFVLAARVVKAWPGAKEPGESGHGGPRRRQMLPPGVPDPNEWGPQKGTLPAAPARGARTQGGERAARAGTDAAGERPARRMRTAGEGSVSQSAASAAPGAQGAQGAQEAAPGRSGETTPGRPADNGTARGGARPRRARSASEGSASQREGAAPQAPRDGTDGSGTPRTAASGSGAGAPDAASDRSSEDIVPKDITQEGVAADGVGAEGLTPDDDRPAGPDDPSGGPGDRRA
jgi:NADH:ubiquinone oxidoreductase subunit C